MLKWELLHSPAGKGVWSMLSSLANQMQALNEQAHSFTFDIIFHPLKEKLQRIPNLKVCMHLAMSLACTLFLSNRFGSPVQQVLTVQGFWVMTFHSFLYHLYHTSPRCGVPPSFLCPSPSCPSPRWETIY
jgi:hypothetical protein